jgi:hypothetical protein
MRVLRDYIKNSPDWCRQLYNSCGSAKHRSKQAKLWITGSTATFCGDCVKTCEDVAPNFGENRPGCFTMTTPRLTLPYPAVSGEIKTWLSSPTHRTPLFWHPATSTTTTTTNIIIIIIVAGKDTISFMQDIPETNQVHTLLQLFCRYCLWCPYH